MNPKYAFCTVLYDDKLNIHQVTRHSLSYDEAKKLIAQDTQEFYNSVLSCTVEEMLNKTVWLIRYNHQANLRKYYMLQTVDGKII